MHHESSIIVIIVIIIRKKTRIVHEEKYMYKFYAVQRWSSYAYSAVNLKVGGVYLMLCYLQIVHFVEAFFVCDVKTLLCKYSKKKCLSCSWVLSLSLCWYHLYNNKSVWNLLCKRTCGLSRIIIAFTHKDKRQKIDWLDLLKWEDFIFFYFLSLHAKKKIMFESFSLFVFIFVHLLEQNKVIKILICTS